MDNSASSGSPGLFGSLAGVGRNLLGLLLARLELASFELSEARRHLLRQIVVFALTLLAGAFALAYGSATLVFLAWDALGWKILPLMGMGFLLVCVGLALYGRALLRQHKFSLPATMAELKADRDMLL